MPQRNSKLYKQHKARLALLESGVSSLKFLHADAKDLYRHKLKWRREKSGKRD